MFNMMINEIKRKVEDIFKRFDVYNLSKIFVPGNDFEKFIHKKENIEWINSQIEINNKIYRIKKSELYIDFWDIDIYYLFNLKNDIYRKDIDKFICLLISLFVLQKIVLKRPDQMYFDKEKYGDLNNILYYYRGQSNSTWRLIPSLYRRLTNSYCVDNYFLYYRYNNIGLRKKYIEHIDRDNSDIDYGLLSFMQHSCAYSPLLDFTEEKIVATSFALNKNVNINDFERDDSCIFELSIYNEKVKILTEEKEINDFIKNEFKMYYIDKKSIKLGDKIILNKFDSSGKMHNIELKYSSIKELIELLTPQFVVINNKTNDRMKYQKGLFILFYNCLCIGDIILYELSPYLGLNKNVISHKDKANELKKIYQNNREYTMDYLLNPYKIFNE